MKKEKKERKNRSDCCGECVETLFWFILCCWLWEEDD